MRTLLHPRHGTGTGGALAVAPEVPVAGRARTVRTWVAACAVIGAAAAAIGIVAQPRGPGPLQLEIDPSGLPTR